MANTYVFRVSEDDDFVRSEFSAGRLRQGWGNHDTGLDQSKDAWVDKYCAFSGSDNKSYYRTKYNNLRIMLEIKPGDILIIPKLPKPSMFTVCRAAGEYTFREPEGYEWDDFYHMVPIDTGSVREFGNTADEDCGIISAKFKAYRHPLNHVWLGNVCESAERLLGKPNNPTSDIEGIVSEIKADVCGRSGVYEATLDRLRALGDRSTERIVEAVFEKLGYTLTKRNSYDGKGGDADLIYASDPPLSELLDVAENDADFSQQIYVQVKDKSGVDGGDTEGCRQLMKRAEGDVGAVKILISTADSFTKECVELAGRDNILLINGAGLMRLVFKYLD